MSHSCWHRGGSQVEILVDPDWYQGPKERFPFPGRKLFSGTFKHSVAMENDSLQFFGPGHELIDFLVSEFHAEGEGRAAAARATVLPQDSGRMFVWISARCSPDLAKWDNDDLPPALRLGVKQFSPIENRSVVLELLPHQEASFRTPRAEEQEFIAGLQTSANFEKLSPGELDSAAPLTLIWQSLSAATCEAVRRIRDEREVVRTSNAEKFRNHLMYDRRYLEWRSAQWNSEASNELLSFDHAIESILEESVEIDSVYLVLGVAAS